MAKKCRSSQAEIVAYLVFVLATTLVWATPVAAESIAGTTYVVSYAQGTLFHALVKERTEAVYDQAGLKVRFVAVPNMRSLAMANAGEVDADAGRVPSVLERYPNLRRVEGKLMELNGTVYTRRTDIQIYDEGVLRSFRVGYARGVQWAENKMSGSDAIKANDYAMLFNMLSHGRIDIALATEASAVKTLQDMENSASKAIRQLQPFIFSAPIHHYVHKKNVTIIPRLEAAIRELVLNGRFDE